MGRSAVKISQRLTTSQQWAAFIAFAILFTGLSFSYLVTSQLRQQLLLQQQQLATNSSSSQQQLQLAAAWLLLAAAGCCMLLGV